MYGKVIGTSIAVDCFEEVTKNGIYFLTEGQLKAPLPPHVDRVYTSPHNAWLLRTKYQIDPEKIVVLPLNKTFLIQDKIKKLDFYVTLMDAKQKPGAVMFLFEGDEIGNILYAGKCCYSDSFFSRPLVNFLKLKVVDYLYIHDACDDCQSHSITTTAAVEDIINTIRWNSNCKVVITEQFFREDILAELKDRLRKPICVSEEVMKHLEGVGRGSDFTLDPAEAQVFITAKLHDKRYLRTTSDGQPILRIILLPCSMKRSSQEIQGKLHKLEKKGYHVILYRNHCSPPELVSLVRDINAKYTVLIRPPPSSPRLPGRIKDLDYWSHLGNFQRIIEVFDRFQNETNHAEAMEVSDSNVVRETEFENALDGIMESKNNKDEEIIESKKDSREEITTPDSFILIDSDIESIASKETILNTPAIFQS